MSARKGVLRSLSGLWRIAPLALSACVGELPVDVVVDDFPNLAFDVRLAGLDEQPMVGLVDTVHLSVRIDGVTVTGLRVRWAASDSSGIAVRSLKDSVELGPDATLRDSLDTTLMGEIVYLARGSHDLLIQIDSAGVDEVRRFALTVRADERWQSVSAGEGHTCAVTYVADGSAGGLRPGGEAHCWGEGEFGALGTGSADQSDVPERVASLVRFREVAAGRRYTCGQDVDRLLHCWGDNISGQLGLGNRLDQFVPRLIALSEGFRGFGVGKSLGFTCALRIQAGNGDGGTLCWGYNEDGQLGCGSEATLGLALYAACDTLGLDEPNTRIPLTVRDVARRGLVFSSLGVGAGHSCGVEEGTGIVHCWGFNSAGELGVSFDDFPSSDVARAVAGYTFEEVVAAGRNIFLLQRGGFTCGIESGRERVLCWGWPVGGGANDRGFEPTPVAGLPAGPLRAITAGTSHACVLGADHRAYCWGLNGDGQLGDGTEVRRTDAAEVAGGLRFRKLSAGHSHTCGVVAVDLDVAVDAPEDTRGGSLYCWGDNGDGQLGVGGVESSSVPLRVVEPPAGA